MSDTSVTADVFAWCIRNARRTFASGLAEESSQWASLAADFADRFGCGYFVSPELENHLLTLAGTLPVPTPPTPAPGAVKRWLHVLTETAVGGHTSLVTRWIALDTSGDQHIVVLTNQDRAVPPALSRAVEEKGGTVQYLAPQRRLMDRAGELRRIAWEYADRVVLHTHMWDVIASLAFGVAGGPPVLLLDHADHTFWVGGAVTDLVINLRAAGEHIADEYRGIPRHCLLPLPLPTPAEPGPPGSTRADVRRELGVPDDAILILSVGTSFKYRPTPGMDFAATAGFILQACPDAHMAVVGPGPHEPHWVGAIAASNRRLNALGVRQDLSRLHAAADVYVEGFPIGSPTALLEAALAGVPCVRAPRSCPELFRSGSPALTGDAPEDTARYAQTVIRLVRSAEERRAEGLALAERVAAVHCGARWFEQLQVLKAGCPSAHRLYPMSRVPKMSPRDAQFWAAVERYKEWTDPGAFGFRSAVRRGLTPRLDAAFVRRVLWTPGEATSKGGLTVREVISEFTPAWIKTTLKPFMPRVTKELL